MMTTDMTPATTTNRRMPDPRESPANTSSLDIMKPPELAAQLKITVRTLNTWDRLRIGPPKVKIGRRCFYRRSQVLEWLRKHETKLLRGR